MFLCISSWQPLNDVTLLSSHVKLIMSDSEQDIFIPMLHITYYISFKAD